MNWRLSAHRPSLVHHSAIIVHHYLASELPKVRKDPEPVRRWTWPHYYLWAGFVRLVLSLLGGFQVHGRRNVPRRGAGLICPNHVSYLDPPAVGGALLPRRTYYFAKQELFKNPVFAFIIRKMYAFPVDRGSGDREAIRHAMHLLEQGELLVLFPEGGRSPDGSLQPGNLGAALMAAKTGAPIIPTAVKGTDSVMPLKGGFHRSRVQVDFGAPLYASQFGERRLTHEQLEAFAEALMAAIYELQQQQYAREGQTAPPRTLAGTGEPAVNQGQ
jgi:1-acyl-sn-glycerol-3-phosphate acyltransferase